MISRLTSSSLSLRFSGLYLRNISTTPPHPSIKKKLTLQQHQLLNEIIRVNQAGELGANAIYNGQISILGRNKVIGPLLQHMKQQEVHHLNTFNQLIPKWRSRPSLLYPIWQITGFTIGAGSAIMGPKVAMVLTEAIETVIGEHYNNQIRKLIQILDEPGNEEIERRDEIKQLVQTLQQFRDDELEHLNTAVHNKSTETLGYPVVKSLLQGGCKLVIEIAKRV